MWRIAAAGDHGVLVRVGSTIDPDVLALVLSLENELSRRHVPGLLGTVPAYASLLCRFDPRVINATDLEAHVRDIEGSLQPVGLTGELFDIPTTYDGPDLQEVASHTGLSVGEIVERHANREYLVYCVGFAPGFTYCGELDTALAVPRKQSPRTSVPAGSVAIAGRQTGIYAVASPGGWNLIGRTTLRLFDHAADLPARFKPGDRLRFVPIT